MDEIDQIISFVLNISKSQLNSISTAIENGQFLIYK